jgi:hypothetical protein
MIGIFVSKRVTQHATFVIEHNFDFAPRSGVRGMGMTFTDLCPATHS